jgi:twitching motility protein PilT
LVFGTLHTTGAAQTMARIIDAYPTSQQEQVRAQLATTLLAVISQTLVPIKSGDGRVAAYELMFCVPAVRHLIRENQTFKIDSIIQTSSKLGMSLLDDSLYDLFVSGRIALEEALQRAPNPDIITEKLRERREHQGLR